MSKLSAWVQAHAKAVVALIVAGVGSAITTGLLTGTAAAAGAVLTAVLTAAGVHQTPNQQPGAMGEHGQSWVAFVAVIALVLGCALAFGWITPR